MVAYAWEVWSMLSGHAVQQFGLHREVLRAADVDLAGTEGRVMLVLLNEFSAAIQARQNDSGKAASGD